MSPVKKENIIAAYPQATLERLENLIDFFILFFKSGDTAVMVFYVGVA